MAAEAIAVACAVYACSYFRELYRWVRHWLRRTVVYKHRFGAQAGQHLHYRIVYVGISNRPDLRHGQHVRGSWWEPLTDPALYTERWHRTRLGAALVERWTIRARCPLGNVQHNRRYRQQSGEREFLRVAAGAHRTRQEPLA
jgi:hypothetical protein